MRLIQRGWKGQPEGLLKGCGIDPLMVGRLTRGCELTLGRAAAQRLRCLLAAPPR